MPSDFERLWKKAHKVLDGIIEGAELTNGGVKSADETMEKVRDVLNTIDTPEKQAAVLAGVALIATVILTNTIATKEGAKTTATPEQK